MGAFAEYLHIPPWDIGRLTYEQFDALVAYLEAKNQ